MYELINYGVWLQIFAYKMYVYDTTFKHGQMAAILFMQIRWLLLIYELFEPLAALEIFVFFTDDVFMYNQSTLLIISLLSQSHFLKK